VVAHEAGGAVRSLSALDGLKEAVDGIRDRESRFMNFLKSDRFNLADAKASNGY
jgi:hypothetical protein